MMMSVIKRKGSMHFRRRAEAAILTAPMTSSIVRCGRTFRIETAGAEFYATSETGFDRGN
jgi:hypothetical protein